MNTKEDMIQIMRDEIAEWKEAKELRMEKEAHDCIMRLCAMEDVTGIDWANL